MIAGLVLVVLWLLVVTAYSGIDSGGWLLTVAAAGASSVLAVGIYAARAPRRAAVERKGTVR